MTSKRVLFVVLLALAITACSANAKNYGDKCKVDSDCGTETMVCSLQNSKKICKQKGLFPMLGREIGGMVLMVVLSMFAVIAGAGGGPLYVPVLQLIFGMSSKETVALSNGLTVFSSCSSLIGNLGRKDPDIPRRSLINFDALLTINPTLLLGSAVGAILNSFMADVVRMIVFVFLIMYAITQSIKKTRDLLQKERAQAFKEQEPAQKAIADKPEPSERIRLESAPQEPEKAGLSLPPAEPAAGDSTARAVAATTEPAEDAALREAIVSQEGRVITWPNMLSIWGSFVIAGVIALLRGGSGFKGWANSSQCDSVDWVLFTILAVAMFVFAFFGSRYVLRKQQNKTKLKLHDKNEVEWTTQTIGKGWAFTVFMGACSTLSGLGGGSIMAPFFYSINLMPKTASATSLLTIFFSKIVVTVMNYVAGVLPLYYLLFVGSFIFVGGVISNYMSGYIQTKFKRQSFISGIFVFEIGVCLVLFCIASGLSIANSSSGVLKFASYC